LVCDEPTGNLDPDTSVGIMQLLYRINRSGTTILMVTHDREMVDKMRKRMIARVRLLFSEAWSSITANVSTTFAAVITVLISMFLLGLLIALGTWLLSYSDHVKKGVLVKVYFASTATPAQELQVGQKLRNDPRVKHVVFVSKAKAFALEKKQYPDLYAHVPSNPLP